ncbi:MAG: hypothetical protein FJY29_04005 [Betaproteobacteria bacterium]|nr:hypothetical protein [Betaproteobacteria bacterium]
MTLTTDDWLSLQSTGPSETAVQNLLSCSSPAAEGIAADVIVGGGLAGLLLALKLSSAPSKAPLVLLESRPSLGGRLFQAPPLSPGVSRAEALRAQFSHEALQHCSGPGFELFDPLALEVYERHLRMLLTDAEQEFLESFTKERTPAEQPFTRRTLLVRKEFTPLTEALSGSSEMLTRKEADILLQLAQPENISPENDGAFEASAFWQGLSKAQRESLTPLLETVLGWTLDRTPVSVVRSAVHAFVKSNESEVPKWFLRTSRLELGLEIVLLSRGVRALTQAELVRAFVPEKKAEATLIQVADMFARTPQQMTARKLALAIPLMRSLAVLPREQLHPQQSRLVSRHRPRSLVWVEYGNWKQAQLSTVAADTLVPGTRLVCPVERVQGALLSNGQLGFYTSIDFEDSLHAQSVREALNRCRKAALRFLSEPHMKAAQQARPAAPGITLMRERISLVPVGYNLPRNEAVPTTTEVKMAPGNWFSAGDHFTFAAESWRNVIDSTHDVAQLMLKN